MAKSITLGVGGTSDATMRAALTKLQTNACDMVLNSAALAIGTAKAKILIANTTRFMIDGVIYSKATAELTLTTAHSVTADLFNVLVVSITAAGTVTVTAGTAGATLAAVVFPTIPAASVVIGFVIINPTGTGNFVGGTTELDDATVVPNAVYVDTPYPFNPNALSL